MANIADVRRFAGADPAADDGVLDQCYAAAVAWYRLAGITAENARDPEAYDFWIANLAAWYYDNRGGGTDVPPYITASVHQLRPARTGG